MSHSSQSDPEGKHFLQAGMDVSMLPTPDSPPAPLSPDGMTGVSSILNSTAEPNPPPPITSHGVAQPSHSYGPVSLQQFNSRAVQGPRSTMQVLSTVDGEGHSSAAGVSDGNPQLSNIMASRNPVSDGTHMSTPERKIVSVKNLRGARPSPEPGSADRPPRKSPRPADEVEDLRRKLEEVTSQASRDRVEISSEARDAAERVLTRQQAEFQNAAQNFKNTAAKATHHEVAQQQAHFHQRHQQVLGDLRSCLLYTSDAADE